MEYLTASEIAAKWNVSEQLVRRHCRENRIPDAYQEFGTWYIPADAEKPARKPKEVKPTPLLLQKIIKQRDGKQYRGFYEYLQINMVYSSGRMASNRLTRNQVEVLYKKDRIFTTSEDIKVNDTGTSSFSGWTSRYPPDNKKPPITAKILRGRRNRVFQILAA